MYTYILVKIKKFWLPILMFEIKNHVCGVEKRKKERKHED